MNQKAVAKACIRYDEEGEYFGEKAKVFGSDLVFADFANMLRETTVFRGGQMLAVENWIDQIGSNLGFAMVKTPPRKNEEILIFFWKGQIQRKISFHYLSRSANDTVTTSGPANGLTQSWAMISEAIFGAHCSSDRRDPLQ